MILRAGPVVDFSTLLGCREGLGKQLQSCILAIQQQFCQFRVAANLQGYRPQQSCDGGVLVMGRCSDQENLSQLLAQRDFVSNGRGVVFQKQALSVITGRLVQRSLGGEVGIKCRVGHADSLANLLESGLGVTLLRKQLHGGGKNARQARLLVAANRPTGPFGGPSSRVQYI